MNTNNYKKLDDSIFNKAILFLAAKFKNNSKYSKPKHLQVLDKFIFTIASFLKNDIYLYDKYIPQLFIRRNGSFYEIHGFVPNFYDFRDIGYAIRETVLRYLNSQYLRLKNIHNKDEKARFLNSLFIFNNHFYVNGLFFENLIENRDDLPKTLQFPNKLEEYYRESYHEEYKFLYALMFKDYKDILRKNNIKVDKYYNIDGKIYAILSSAGIDGEEGEKDLNFIKELNITPSEARAFLENFNFNEYQYYQINKKIDEKRKSKCSSCSIDNKFYPDYLIKHEDELINKNIDKFVKETLRQNYQRFRGELPNHLQEILDEIFEMKINWTDILRRRLFTKLENISARIWNYPNIFYLNSVGYLPSNDKEPTIRNITVFVDTSGSIDLNELKKFYGIIYDLINEQNIEYITIVQHDAEIEDIKILNRDEVIDVDTFLEYTKMIIGRGGTSHEVPVKDYLDMIDSGEIIETDFIIFLSDFYTDNINMIDKYLNDRGIDCFYISTTEAIKNYNIDMDKYLIIR